LYQEIQRVKIHRAHDLVSMARTAMDGLASNDAIRLE